MEEKQSTVSSRHKRRSRGILLALLALAVFGPGVGPDRIAGWLFLETDAFASEARVDDAQMPEVQGCDAKGDRDASVDPPPPPPPPKKKLKHGVGREPMEFTPPPSPEPMSPIFP